MELAFRFMFGTFALGIAGALVLIWLDAGYPVGTKETIACIVVNLMAIAMIVTNAVMAIIKW
jgi:hypothetical protein